MNTHLALALLAIGHVARQPASPAKDREAPRPETSKSAAPQATPNVNEAIALLAARFQRGPK